LTLVSFVEALQKHKWVVVGSVVIATLAAGTVSYLQPTRYQAEAVVMVVETDLPSALLGVSYRGDARRAMQTQIEMVSLPPIVQAAAKSIGSSEPTDEILGRVSVTGSAHPNGSNLITIEATDQDPAEAVALANSMAEAYIDWTREFGRERLADAASAIQTDVDEALVNAAKPRKRKDAAGLIERDAATELYSSLAARQQNLSLAESLEIGAGFLVSPAQSDSVTRSADFARNTLLGLVFGLVLGVTGALALDALSRGRTDSGGA